MKAAQLNHELHNLYVRAAGLMVKRKGVSATKALLPAIESCFDELLKMCVETADDELVPGLYVSKADLIKKKLAFDVQVSSWICESERLVSEEDILEAAPMIASVARHSLSCCSSGSSTRSKKLESQAKLKVASVAVEQERVKVYQTRSCAREQAERKKRETQDTARKAQEEAERELLDAEEKAECGLLEKQHELELAKVNAWQEAWQENGEKDRNNVLAQAISQPKALIGKAPFDANTSPGFNVKLTTINTFNLAKEENTNKMVSISVPVCTMPYNTLQQYTQSQFSRFAVDANSIIKHLFVSGNLNPIPSVSGTDDLNNVNCYPPPFSASPIGKGYQPVESKQYFQNGNSSFVPRQPHINPLHSRLIKPPIRSDRPAQAVVIQKFDGDPMNYWLSARQFEAHVLGKVEEHELFPLLYQCCKSAVQLNISHFSNQFPSVAFCMAWDLLYDEYGHSHEIARCLEELLRSAPKVPEDDREKLKSLANLLVKCCVSVKDIGQTSSLDTTHVIMSIVNKLPLDLKERE